MRLDRPGYSAIRMSFIPSPLAVSLAWGTKDLMINVVVGIPAFSAATAHPHTCGRAGSSPAVAG